MIAAALCTASLWLAGDAFVTLEPALRAAERAPPSPLLQLVRGERHDALVAQDVHEALPAADALSPTLASVDAAAAEVSCALPANGAAAVARVERLSDQLLVVATVDAAAGKPSTAVAGISRAVDVARLLVRCDGASLQSLEAARRALGRARARVGAFLDAGWLDRKVAPRAVALLDPPGEAELLRCAGPLATKAEIDAARAALRRDGAATRALAQRAAQAPAAVEQGDRVGVPDVEVRCEQLPARANFLVSRPVLAVLRARGAQAVIGDSQLFFALDGTGLWVVTAGPGARSCGFRDQDVLVAVNGRPVATAQDILAAQQVVGADGRAVFTVRRAGQVTDLILEPKEP